MNDYLFHFVSPVYLYIFAALTYLALFRQVHWKTTPVTGDLNGHTSNQLKGFFILTVVLHHICQRTTEPGAFIVYKNLGFLAVAVFFYLSGYGLMRTAQKNPTYLQGFITKRLARVYIPFVVASAVLSFLAPDAQPFSFGHYVLDVLGIHLFDSTQWFILAILYFYLLFFVSMKAGIAMNNGLYRLVTLYAGTLGYIVLCKLLHLGIWWYNACLLFPLGITVAIYLNPITRFLQAMPYWIMTGVVCLAAYASYSLSLKEVTGTGFLAPILFTASVVLLLSRVGIQSALMSFIGTISLEIYILHMKLMAVYHQLTLSETPHSSAWLAVYFAVLICTAWLFSQFNQWLMHCLHPEPARQSVH